MAGEGLHDYDLQLCNYALGNISQYFREPGFTEWVKGELTPEMFDDLFGGDRTDVLIGTEVFDTLSSVFRDGGRGVNLPWHADTYRHARYVLTVREVRDELTRQVAETWAAECARTVASLEESGVSLAVGLRLVGHWVENLRRLLRAMRATQYLPDREDGVSRGPARPSPPLLPTPGLDERRSRVIAKLRQAIQADPKGKTIKPDTIIGRAGVNARDGRCGLRWLEEREEYAGFIRKPPADVKHHW